MKNDLPWKGNCWPWRKLSFFGIHLGTDVFFAMLAENAMAGCKLYKCSYKWGRMLSHGWCNLRVSILGLILTSEELFANLEEQTGLILVTKWNFVIWGRDGNLYNRIYLDFKSAHFYTQKWLLSVVPPGTYLKERNRVQKSRYSLKRHVLKSWKFSPK